MHFFVENVRRNAQKKPCKIVFPEAGDARVIEAVRFIEKENIARPLLLTEDAIDPGQQERFVQEYFETRNRKKISLDEVRESMRDPLMYAAMLVHSGEVDGFVAGAHYTTAAVIRSALHCLDLDQSIGILTSCFVMAVPECSYGEQGLFVYADCGVIPSPTSEQLASIAIAAGRFARDVLDIVPRVALLSFSTKGSAMSKSVKRVEAALEMARQRCDEFPIDGELQADAALVPAVAEKKVSSSEVAGQANVLVFPDLDAGNICYKITERLAKAKAWGPIILGTVQPCSDLSRGCSVEDIVDCAAITAIRAQKRKS